MLKFFPPKSSLRGVVLAGLIFVLLFSPFSPAIPGLNISEAATSPSRSIAVNTVWTKAGSPYIIASGLNIATGAKLTLEPGTIVKTKEDAIYVQGELIAAGTANEPVIFTSLNDDAAGGDSNPNSAILPSSGDWAGLFARYGGKITLDHAIIRYGGFMPVTLLAGNDFIRPNEARAASGYDCGAVSVWGGEARIINSEITRNNIGLEFSPDSSRQAFFSVQSSRIHANLQGAVVYPEYVPGRGSYAENINATGNWWGDNSGPFHPSLNPAGKGNPVSDNILFDPWTGRGVVLAKQPVIIVPGIMGSYLNRNDGSNDEIWPNIAKMILPGDDNYLDELTLPASGEPAAQDIVPGGIIRNLASSDIFKGLIKELENSGYEEGKDLFVFPYDWRLSIDRAAGVGAGDDRHNLADKIDEVREATGADQVDIVAHSMGGLVVKKYLQAFGTSSVDKFIDIATPHLGAPKAFKALTYGDDMGFRFYRFGLDGDRVKIITQNMPAVYQLLPSSAYFLAGEADYRFYIGDIYDQDGNGVAGGLDYGASAEFMRNAGRNAGLVELAGTIHAAIDEYYPQDQGVATHNIIGCGLPTIGRVYVLNREKSGGYEYGLRYIDGDGTVPLLSARKMLHPDAFVRGGEHAFLASGEGTREMVAAILAGKKDEFDFASHPELSRDGNICGLNGTQVSFHSPVDLHAYDEAGNHAGPDENGRLEINIPGAQYDIIDGNKFVFLPAGQEYRVEGRAAGAGTFNARVEKIDKGIYGEEAYFNEIPLASTSTKAEIAIGGDVAGAVIRLDQDGDGAFEAAIAPNSVLSPAEAADLKKPRTEMSVSAVKDKKDRDDKGGKDRKKDKKEKDDDRKKDKKKTGGAEVILEAADNEGGSGILRTEYSLDNGASWSDYEGPIIIDKPGEYAILYFSTDRAGNAEKIQTGLVSPADFGGKKERKEKDGRKEKRDEGCGGNDRKNPKKKYGQELLDYWRRLWHN